MKFYQVIVPIMFFTMYAAVLFGAEEEVKGLFIDEFNGDCLLYEENTRLKLDKLTMHKDTPCDIAVFNKDEEVIRVRFHNTNGNEVNEVLIYEMLLLSSMQQIKGYKVPRDKKK